MQQNIKQRYIFQRISWSIAVFLFRKDLILLKDCRRLRDYYVDFGNINSVNEQKFINKEFVLQSHEATAFKERFLQYNRRKNFISFNEKEQNKNCFFNILYRFSKNVFSLTILLPIRILDFNNSYNDSTVLGDPLQELNLGNSDDCKLNDNIALGI